MVVIAAALSKVTTFKGRRQRQHEQPSVDRRIDKARQCYLLCQGQLAQEGADADLPSTFALDCVWFIAIAHFCYATGTWKDTDDEITTAQAHRRLSKRNHEKLAKLVVRVAEAEDLSSRTDIVCELERMIIHVLELHQHTTLDHGILCKVFDLPDIPNLAAYSAEIFDTYNHLEEPDPHALPSD